MNPYTVGPLFAALALVQSTLTAHINILGASPDLVLLLAVACVLQCGTRESLPVILVGGLMIDILSSAPFGAATGGLIIAAGTISVTALETGCVARITWWSRAGR